MCPPEIWHQRRRCSPWWRLPGTNPRRKHTWPWPWPRQSTGTWRASGEKNKISIFMNNCLKELLLWKLNFNLLKFFTLSFLILFIIYFYFPFNFSENWNYVSYFYSKVIHVHQHHFYMDNTFHVRLNPIYWPYSWNRIKPITIRGKSIV